MALRTESPLFAAAFRHVLLLGVVVSACNQRRHDEELRSTARLYETITHHISVDCGKMPVVTPGSPEKSALVKVLKGPCSAKVPQMPNGCQPALGNCLPANYVTAVERWIAAGAPKD